MGSFGAGAKKGQKYGNGSKTRRDQTGDSHFNGSEDEEHYENEDEDRTLRNKQK